MLSHGTEQDDQNNQMGRSDASWIFLPKRLRLAYVPSRSHRKLEVMCEGWFAGYLLERTSNQQRSVMSVTGKKEKWKHTKCEQEKWGKEMMGII